MRPHGQEIAITLLLLACANGTPILLKRVFGSALATPLDLNRTLSDGYPLFGPGKTIRGLLGAIVATGAAAPVLGLDAGTGALVALLAMVGDLLASFLKRRLGLSPHAQAIGLDQVPEALLPMLALRGFLEPADMATVVVLFVVLELLLSRVLFRIGIRDRPY